MQPQSLERRAREPALLKPGASLLNTALEGMEYLSLGVKPAGAINPEVFDRPGFKAKWKQYR